MSEKPNLFRNLLSYTCKRINFLFGNIFYGVFSDFCLVIYVLEQNFFFGMIRQHYFFSSFGGGVLLVIGICVAVLSAVPYSCTVFASMSIPALQSCPILRGLVIDQMYFPSTSLQYISPISYIAAAEFYITTAKTKVIDYMYFPVYSISLQQISPISYIQQQQSSTLLQPRPTPAIQVNMTSSQPGLH